MNCSIHVIEAALSDTEMGNRSLDDSVTRRSISVHTDKVTELRATQSHQKSNNTSQGVFIYARTSVRNKSAIDRSTMGPMLSVIIR